MVQVDRLVVDVEELDTNWTCRINMLRLNRRKKTNVEPVEKTPLLLLLKLLSRTLKISMKHVLDTTMDYIK